MHIGSNAALLPALSQSRANSPDKAPVTESWSVGSETYSSTADLVSHSQGKDGESAIYSFSLKPDAAPFSKSERLKHAALHAAGGAVAGAFGGACLGAIGSFLGGIGDFANQVLGNGSSGESVGILLPVIAGAVIGAGVEAYNGYKDDGKAPVFHMQGKLQVQGPDVAFYVGGQVDHKVGLNGQAGPLLIKEYESLPHADS